MEKAVKTEIQFCKDCSWYDNNIPEDICLNDRFVILDVITGKKILPTCIQIRSDKKVNPHLSACVGYRSIVKDH